MWGDVTSWKNHHHHPFCFCGLPHTNLILTSTPSRRSIRIGWRHWFSSLSISWILSKGTVSLRNNYRKANFTQHKKPLTLFFSHPFFQRVINRHTHTHMQNAHPSVCPRLGCTIEWRRAPRRLNGLRKPEKKDVWKDEVPGFASFSLSKVLVFSPPHSSLFCIGNELSSALLFFFWV